MAGSERLSYADLFPVIVNEDETVAWFLRPGDATNFASELALRKPEWSVEVLGRDAGDNGKRSLLAEYFRRDDI